LRLLLELGYSDLRALRLPRSNMNLVRDIASQVEWADGDVLDLPALDEAITGRDWVFHCAGIISFDPRKARTMRAVNVGGTANVANLCLDHQVESMLHVSSIAALGRTKPGQTISEKSKWERSPLNTNYGISKFLAEQEVWRAMEEGLNAIIINPSIILGSGDWSRGPARFFPLIDKGFPFYPLGGTDLVDVRDVARAMVTLMEQGIRHERFIVSAGKMNYRHFFSQIASALQKPGPRYAVRPWMQAVAWRLAWIKSRLTHSETLVTRETIQQSALEYTYENTKLIGRIGFEYTPLDQTISETALAFLRFKGQTTPPTP
jgi:nucleoside-diphosphate-sugar epimerase